MWNTMRKDRRVITTFRTFLLVLRLLYNGHSETMYSNATLQTLAPRVRCLRGDAAQKMFFPTLHTFSFLFAFTSLVSLLS